MATCRRAVAVLGVALGLIMSALAAGTPASAAPYTTAPTVAVSTTNPCVGCPLTISVAGFAANEQINVTLHTTVYNLGTATADSSGATTTTVTLPAGVSGAHTIVAVGATSGPSASIAITIGGAPGGGGGGGGGLPNTGVAAIGIGAVGVALIVGGGAALLAGRRRRIKA